MFKAQTFFDGLSFLTSICMYPHLVLTKMSKMDKSEALLFSKLHYCPSERPYNF